MKQGLTSVFPVEIGMSLDDVQSIKFLFTQLPNTSLEFTYPSTTAVRNSANDNIVNLKWTPANTYKFKTDRDITLDTMITLTADSVNPETELVTFRMNPTMFKEVTSNGSNS